MSVASLFNVPTTPEEFSRWAFEHAAHHREEVMALNAELATSLPMYVLDPVPAEFDTFLLQHQIMHNNTEAVTGVGGYDLTSVDFSDPEQLQGWIYLNAELHYNEANALGVW